MESLTALLRAVPVESRRDRRRRPDDGDAILDPPDLPAAARPAVSSLFLLTLLSAVDGSLLVLAAQGALDSFGGAVTVGLTVIAGAGSWLAAHRAFAGRRLRAADHAAWLGVHLGTAVTLHVLPKAAGVVLWLVAAEVAGLRLPRPGRVPLPLLALAAGSLLEVVAQWTP